MNTRVRHAGLPTPKLDQEVLPPPFQRSIGSRSRGFGECRNHGVWRWRFVAGWFGGGAIFNPVTDHREGRPYPYRRVHHGRIDTVSRRIRSTPPNVGLIQVLGVESCSAMCTDLVLRWTHVRRGEHRRAAPWCPFFRPKSVRVSLPIRLYRSDPTIQVPS